MADDPKPKSDKTARAGKPLDELMALYRKAAKDGTMSPQVTDALTQALLLILGSGPSVAAYDALLHAQEANGIL